MEIPNSIEKKLFIMVQGAKGVHSALLLKIFEF